MTPAASILGIDPGLKGALALYDARFPSTAKVWDMPTTRKGVDGVELARLLEMIHRLCPGMSAVIEEVGGRPRQQGVFDFGLGVGIIHGCLASAGIPFTLVSPSRWKPEMGLRRGPAETKPENKSRSRALATKLFPTLASSFARVVDDGRAEALLIAFHEAHRHGV